MKRLIAAVAVVITCIAPPVRTPGPVAVVYAATPPTLVGSSAATFTTGNTARTTGSLSWVSGDIILVFGMTADNLVTLTTPTGSGLTFAALTGTPTSAASSAKGYAWSATASGSASGAISSTQSGGSGTAGSGIVAYVYRGSDGLGTPAVSTSLGATTTQNLTRAQANSAVAQIWGDFNAVNDVVVTWTPSGQTEDVATNVSGQATFFAANWGDQGSTGTTAYGFSGFAGGDMTAITVEIKGAAGGGGPTCPKTLLTLGVGC
jgi:hypothetical protein